MFELNPPTPKEKALGHRENELELHPAIDKSERIWTRPLSLEGLLGQASVG